MTERTWNDIPRLHTGEIDLPRELGRLYDLAYNLWWTWTPAARELFSAIDSRSWALYHNPVQVLLGVEHHTWEEKLEDDAFLSLYNRVVQAFERYLLSDREETWFARSHPEASGPFVYFCMEFGLHQSLPLYSGGLGVLAGDYLKSASDLGLPLLGVGLLYRRGYFRQTIDADGRQQHTYPEHDFNRLPVRPAGGATGRPVVVSIPLPDREIRAQIWIADVGRIPLLLLDTDISANDTADRPITSILYTPGREMRLVQEIVLGLGGARALAELGIEPRIWHMNEGHSALLQFERLRRRLDQGEEVESAIAALKSNSVFTTHTPVPAGNEEFDHGLVRRYFEPWCADGPLTADRWTSLGNNDHGEPGQPFNMTALAIRTSSRINGVSKLNAEVATRMWRHLVPEDRPEPEQIHAITNGVHPQTWLGVEMQDLFARWFGDKWHQVLSSEIARVAILENSDQELWAAHRAQKDRLGRFLRSRLRDHRARHGLSPGELREVEEMFDPDALTLGFARRFAVYKRAGLLFSDLHRLRQLVTQESRPLQILLAGKAHPADKAGQELIQHLFQLSLGDPLRGRVFFVEDYDMRVGRMLVQGVDVWLNTPRRPMEASGTSGMKAAMNGALNCSIADGWWPEGHQGENGWIITGKNCGSDEAAQDREDALALYHLLEEEIVPQYYDRDEEGLPRHWIARMKEAIATVTPRFSSDRMVAEYCESSYLPLLRED